LINGKQAKLVNAETIIRGCKPIFGKRNAPDRPEQVPARLFILQSNANDVASFPGIVLLAIHAIIFKKINIPIKLKIIP
jgi:hypothetical protein